MTVILTPLAYEILVQEVVTIYHRQQVFVHNPCNVNELQSWVKYYIFMFTSFSYLLSFVCDRISVQLPLSWITCPIESDIVMPCSELVPGSKLDGASLFLQVQGENFLSDQLRFHQICHERVVSKDVLVGCWAQTEETVELEDLPFFHVRLDCQDVTKVEICGSFEPAVLKCKAVFILLLERIRVSLFQLLVSLRFRLIMVLDEQISLELLDEFALILWVCFFGDRGTLSTFFIEDHRLRILSSDC